VCKCIVICFKSFINLSVNPLFVTDQSGPELPTIAHGHRSLLYFRFQFSVAIVFLGLHQWNVGFDPEVKLFFGMLILKIRKVVLCTLQLFSGYISLEFIPHCLLKALIYLLGVDCMGKLREWLHERAKSGVFTLLDNALGSRISFLDWHRWIYGNRLS
jgi:hypothetical protein